MVISLWNTHVLYFVRGQKKRKEKKAKNKVSKVRKESARLICFAVEPGDRLEITFQLASSQASTG